jgi:hypothetical protein
MAVLWLNLNVDLTSVFQIIDRISTTELISCSSKMFNVSDHETYLAIAT